MTIVYMRHSDYRSITRQSVDVVLGVQGFPLPSKALVKIKMGEKVYKLTFSVLLSKEMIPFTETSEKPLRSRMGRDRSGC
jgi:hypothetical protein